MTHYLNNIMCMVSEHFTSLESIKVELHECKERATLGYGRYKHNQQLEELRNLQEQLSSERRSWQLFRDEQDRDLAEKRDVEEQRNKLYRKLETLQAQGFEIGTNMTVIGPPPGPNQDTRKNTQSMSQLPPAGAASDRKPSHLPSQVTNSSIKKLSETRASNSHLLSATNESKGGGPGPGPGEMKQQIPLALAKLSMAGSKSKDRKSSSKLVERPSISAPIITSSHPPHLASQFSSSISLQHSQPQQQQPPHPQQHHSQQQHQMLPFKLSESDRKNSSPKAAAGYQKLSSNSFAAAEERVSRASTRPEHDHVSHARTGSSPAAMVGRAMSNTLPKNSGPNGSPDKNDNEKPLKEIQKVNYANTGEEVFYF